MDRRRFLTWTAASATSALVPGCGNLGPATRKSPNVLFVFADQLRADVCGVYGGRNITTPRLDRLTSEGVIFTNAVSTCPLCTPYRGMLQTGRYPTHSGILMNQLEPSRRQNPVCLADVFRAAGYATGFIGKWHLGTGPRREEGLVASDPEAVAAYQASNPETEYVAPGPARLGYAHWQAVNCHRDFNNYWFYEDAPVKRFSGRYETDTETDQAISFMERCRQNGQPFFLNVAPHPPHPPFDPSATPAGYLAQVPEELWWPPNVPADNPEGALTMRCYLAMVKNLDDNLGRLLDYLDVSGLAAETIVVLTSDHGEMHASHGLFAKQLPYAESIDVPLVVRWPGHIPQGSRIDALQTPMDHLPTLCGLAGLAIPPAVDGIDLSGVALGTQRDSREDVLLANYTSDTDFLTTGTYVPEWRGIRTKRYTYCRWLAGGEALYDNLADPFQMENLAESAAAPAALPRLRARLSDLLAAAHDELRPGTDYAAWFANRYTLLRTGLGPVPR